MKILILICCFLGQLTYAKGLEITISDEEADRVLGEAGVTKSGFNLKIDNKFKTRTYNMLLVSVCEEEICQQYHYWPMEIKVPAQGAEQFIDFKSFASYISYYNIQKPVLRFAAFNGMTTDWSSYRWVSIPFSELSKNNLKFEIYKKKGGLILKTSPAK